MRALRFNVPICVSMITLVGLPSVASAGVTGFGDFSNFTINKAVLDSGPSPNVIPGQIEITDSAGSETRSLFYNVPQSITSFTASFDYRVVGSSNASYQGLTFCLQNTDAGPSAVAGSLGGFGFEGLAAFDPNSMKSAAVSLELSNPTGTSLYTASSVTFGGANLTGPVNLLSGDLIHVSLSYHGSILSETVLDTVTGQHSDFSYLVNLSHVLGGGNAYVGFTAQTPADGFGVVADQQYLSNFQFNSVPEPSTFILLAIGLMVPVLQLRRRRA